MITELGNNGNWIAVDLDSTLARFDEWKGFDYIGEPIPEILELVKRWLAEGLDVRIFTARASDWQVMAPGTIKDEAYRIQVKPIVDWCVKHVGQALKVTCIKDYKCTQIYDDRCIQVEPNTGRFIGATNTFPDGKLCPEDEGELRIAIGQKDGNVVMNFGKNIDFLAVPPHIAIAIAQSLVQWAGEAFPE